MKTETDTVPPDSGGGDERSISEIISNLRLTFRSSDFNRAEAELVAREVSLRREIWLLRKEKQSALEMRELDRIAMVELREELAAAPASGCGGGADLEAERGRAIAAEEEKRSLTAEEFAMRSALETRELDRIAMVELREELAAAPASGCGGGADLEAERGRAIAAEEEKKSLTAEEFKLRVAALEIDVFELLKSENALRNSGVKSSSKEPIEILDSDDDCARVGKSSREESLSPEVPKRKRSLSPNISGTKDDPLAGGPTIANGNINQEREAPLMKPVKKQALCSSNGSEQPNAFPKPFTSPAKHDSPCKETSLSSSNISEQPNAVPNQTPRASDQADKGSGAKKFSTAHDYKNFWSRFSEIRRATEDSNKERSS